jgi:hypothetical protein
LCPLALRPATTPTKQSSLMTFVGAPPPDILDGSQSTLLDVVRE